MKAIPIFPNNAVPSEDQMEAHYSASIILQKKALAYACMLMQLDLIWTDKVRTAGTDGIYVYVNPAFYFGLPNDEQRAFLLAHEVGHVCLRHMTRATFYDDRGFHSMRGDEEIPWLPRLWNVEGDKIINADLIAHGLQMIPEGLLDSNVGRNDQLDMNYVKAYDAQPQQPDQPDEPGEGEPGDGDESESGEGNGSDQDDSDESQSDDSESGSSDDESGDEGDDADESAGSPTPSDHGGHDDHFTPQYGGDEDQQEIDREDDQLEITQAIEEAIEQANDMAKHMGMRPPGTGSGVFGTAKATLEHEAAVDWRTELAEFISSRSGGTESDWRRIHRRRYAVYGTLNPTPMGMLNKIVFIGDRSGSAHHLLDLFISELAHLTDTLQPTEGVKVLWAGDGVIGDPMEVMSGAELLDMPIPAGGGTYLSPALDRVDEEGWDDADVILCFTDGELSQDDMQAFVDRGALLILDRDPMTNYWAKDVVEATQASYIVVQPD